MGLAYGPPVQYALSTFRSKQPRRFETMSGLISLLVGGLLVVVSSIPATAQQNLPLCVTSTGEPGRLFHNIFGYVAVPKAFDTADTGDETVRLMPNVSGALGPLLVPGKLGPATLRFFDDDTLVFACWIDVIAFDQNRHSIDSITEGACSWTSDRDWPMLTGIARYVAYSERFTEIAVGSPEIADHSTLSDQTIYLLGRAPGVTNITTLGPDGAVIMQCPVIVQDAVTYFKEFPIDDAVLCTDSSGRTARLKVGQSMDISFEDSKRSFDEIAVADPKIASARPRTEFLYQVTAKETGVTNVTTLAKTRLHHNCVVVVE